MDTDNKTTATETCVNSDVTCTCKGSSAGCPHKDKKPMHKYSYDYCSTPLGWKCPECENIYSPSVTMCTGCSKGLNKNIVTVNSSDTVFTVVKSPNKDSTEPSK